MKINKIKIKVSNSISNYLIVIGYNILNQSILKDYLLSNKILIITNKILISLYINKLKLIFNNYTYKIFVLRDGEKYKNQNSVKKIYSFLINNHYSYDTTIISFGGGVISDISGFVASTYHRGVNFLQISTTLLSQVDASIGGKSAINFCKVKNSIGSMYNPIIVINDLLFLQTLPKKEVCFGMSEIIKYSLLVGGNLFKIISTNIESEIYIKNSKKLLYVIKTCCKVKKKFIEYNKYGNQERLLLNLGHTFAHALETYGNYSRWSHGEAVAIGIYCSAVLSYYVSNFPKYSVEIIDNLLKIYNLPRRIPRDVNIEKLYSYMLNDKKVIQNNIKFVLLKSIGNCYVDYVVKRFVLLTLEHAIQK